MDKFLPKDVSNVYTQTIHIHIQQTGWAIFGGRRAGQEPKAGWEQIWTEKGAWFDYVGVIVWAVGSWIVMRQQVPGMRQAGSEVVA